MKIPAPTTLYDLDRDQFAELCAGEPTYRVDQIWQGLYDGLKLPDEMTQYPEGASGPYCRRGTAGTDRDRVAARRQWPDPEMAVEGTRRPSDRNRAHVVPGPGDGVCQLPGWLRYGMWFLRDRPSWV